MSRPLVTVLVGVLLAASLAFANTPGSFRGQIVSAPPGQQSAGYIYLKGRNQMLRRVDVSHARVTYDSAVPSKSRPKDSRQAMKEGAEVRVTATQDGNGEWSATQVEVLQLPQ